MRRTAAADGEPHLWPRWNSPRSGCVSPCSLLQALCRHSMPEGNARKRATLDPSDLPLAITNWFSGMPGQGHESEHKAEAAAVSSAQQSRVPDFPFFSPRKRKACCGVRQETSFPSKSTDACR